MSGQKRGGKLGNRKGLNKQGGGLSAPALTDKDRADIEAAIQRRPYFQAKRDLENMQAVRDRLQARLAEERINAAVGKQ